MPHSVFSIQRYIVYIGIPTYGNLKKACQMPSLTTSMTIIIWLFILIDYKLQEYLKCII